MATNRVISTRMSAEDLAKAMDGLIAKGISLTELNTTSQILRLTFFYGIIAICQDPKSPPSQDSLDFVRQKFGKTKMTRGLNITDLGE